MSVPPTRTLIIIAAGGSPEKRPRLEKTIRLAASQGWLVEFWGWARNPDETCGANLPGVSVSRTLLRGGGYHGSAARLRYPLWVLAVLTAMIRHRPRAVWALGLESALPVWLTRFTGVRYVFDDADRLVLLFRLPALVTRLLAGLERRVSRDASTHVIPGVGRYDYRSSSMAVISNVPDSSQLQRAFAMPVQRPDAALVVYVNGWLTPTRGLDFIMNIMKEFAADPTIIFIVAAKLDSSRAEDLRHAPNALFLGSLDQVTALAWYRVSDLVITFYDPAIAINRFAEPNKWGDAAKMGTAVLVNSEVETAKPWITCGAAFAVQWNDVPAACALLQALAKDRPRVETAIKATLLMGRSLEDFDTAAAPLLDQLDRTLESH